MHKTGNWHGDRYYYGLHYDLHASEQDTELGTRCGADELIPMLEVMAPDFVQTDCKGHPGYTSWFSTVKDASVPPGLTHDALAQWRAATRQLGLPLHCHYSGIWDKAAGAKHPEWCVVTADGSMGGAPFGQNAGAPTSEKMCPRGPYLDQLMIPQMIELIARYGVDGFWIDGDLWAVEPCYCARCRAAWTAQTGLAEPPVEVSDPNWPRWWNFTRESFNAFVTRYCEAVHAHKTGVLVCSNWLQTFKNPGEPTVPTDWISGDNTFVWGVDGSRCEARFLSTRGKPWDIMLWHSYCSNGHGNPRSPATPKPPEMLMQEAAVLLAFGGNVQVYEHPPVRDGRLIAWRQRCLGAVGAFVKARRAICQHTETVPQIAVLHSEHHLFSAVRGKTLFWDVDVAPVRGAVFALLENSYGVDILDEWALRPRLAEFPLVVVPEQDRMSDDMVQALKAYVEDGGNLLLTGSALGDRFGEAFLGFRGQRVEAHKAYAVPVADGDVLLFSSAWGLGETTTAESLGVIGAGCCLDDRLLPHPCAVCRCVGKGRVVYVPAALFTDFDYNRYPLTRQWIGELVARVLPDPAIRVQAPVCVDVALRRRGATMFIHLVNRASGIPNVPNAGAIAEMPPVGPVTASIRMAGLPGGVSARLEPGEVEWTFTEGRLHIRLDKVRLHAAIVIDMESPNLCRTPCREKENVEHRNIERRVQNETNA
ncbi:MAG: alpha-L-fucosidase [Candidatus Marinimicrobia bacterium]|nr:alpha-L-fucosidase [Candidatus Neomarinimicrobiota bacterium]